MNNAHKQKIAYFFYLLFILISNKTTVTIDETVIRTQVQIWFKYK